jgi:hypothetical protein
VQFGSHLGASAAVQADQFGSVVLHFVDYFGGIVVADGGGAGVLGYGQF